MNRGPEVLETDYSTGELRVLVGGRTFWVADHEAYEDLIAQYDDHCDDMRKAALEEADLV